MTTRAINEAAVMLGHLEKPAAGKKVRSPEEKTIGSIKSALRKVIQSLSEKRGCEKQVLELRIVLEKLESLGGIPH